MNPQPGAPWGPPRPPAPPGPGALPPAPGALPPPPGVPVARPGRARWPIALAGAAVAVVLAAAVTFVVARRDRDAGPSEWDPRAAPFTAFVERTAGHRYEHPVQVRFLTDEDFVELIASDPGELTDEDRELYAEIEAEGRALGLYDGSTDLFEEEDTLDTEGVLAYYSPDDREVVVRLPKGVEPEEVTSGDDLPVDVRVTLVHELTHVLQDQVYGIGDVQDLADSDEQDAAVLGLIEGHAEWVAERYLSEELSPEEQDDYYANVDDQAGEYEDATGDVTPVLSAASSAPYVFGPPFVAALHDAGGTDAVDDAFDEPPLTERELMLPGVYLAGDAGGPALEPPEAPGGAEELARTTLGATTTYFLLGLGLPPQDALRAIDAVGADGYVSYRLGAGTDGGSDGDDGGGGDGTVCVDVVLATAPGTDAGTIDLIAAGADGWAAARPAAAGATAERDGDTMRLHACDPGPDADQQVPGDAAIDQVFGRAADLDYLLQDGGYHLAGAQCLVDGLYHEFTADAIVEDGSDVEARIGELLDACPTG